MACCEDETHCPMHANKPNAVKTGARVSQIDADNCCASAEQSSTVPLTASGVASVTPAVLGNQIPAVGPDVALFRENLNALPLVDVSSVPTHLLLSVFLI